MLDLWGVVCPLIWLGQKRLEATDASIYAKVQRAGPRTTKIHVTTLLLQETPGMQKIPDGSDKVFLLEMDENIEGYIVNMTKMTKELQDIGGW